jgi:hypothetical protein
VIERVARDLGEIDRTKHVSNADHRRIFLTANRVRALRRGLRAALDEQNPDDLHRRSLIDAEPGTIPYWLRTSSRSGHRSRATNPEQATRLPYP